MSRDAISYDIKLVNSIYRRNNDALIRLAKRTLENNKNEFDLYLKNLIASKNVKADNKLFAELSTATLKTCFLN